MPLIPAFGVGFSGVLGGLVTLLGGFVDLVTRGLDVLRPLFPILGPIIGGWAAWTAAMWLFNLAVSANPIGALVLARAVNDPDLSNAILRATKKRLDA